MEEKREGKKLVKSDRWMILVIELVMDCWLCYNTGSDQYHCGNDSS